MQPFFICGFIMAYTFIFIRMLLMLTHCLYGVATMSLCCCLAYNSQLRCKYDYGFGGWSCHFLSIYYCLCVSLRLRFTMILVFKLTGTLLTMCVVHTQPVRPQNTMCLKVKYIQSSVFLRNFIPDAFSFSQLDSNSMYVLFLCITV